MHGGPLFIYIHVIIVKLMRIRSRWKANEEDEEDEEEGFGRSGCFVFVFHCISDRSVSRQPPDLIFHFQQRLEVNKSRVSATSCGKTDHLRPYV